MQYGYIHSWEVRKTAGISYSVQHGTTFPVGSTGAADRCNIKGEGALDGDGKD